MATSQLAVRPEVSVRTNILAAGKHLFYIVGYDSAGVDAICREAKSTEAEFILHFGHKEGLLAAILEEGWYRMLVRLPRLQTVVSARARLKDLLRLALEFFDQDRPFTELFLFEGRRLRDGQVMLLTPGYTDFTALVDSLVQIEVPQEDAAVVRSALMGAWEGLVRDLTLRERFGYPADFTGEKAQQYISQLVDCALQPA